VSFERKTFKETAMKQRMAVAVMLAAGLAMTVPMRAQAVKAAAAAAPAGDPQVKDDLFDGTEQFAKNATDVTEVTMDPRTLDMVDGKDKEKAHRMRLNVVRTYTYDKPGMYDMAEVDKFRAKLNTGDWHCSVHTRSLKTGDSTDVCQKTRTDGLVESAIMTVSAKQLTFIHTIREKGASGGSWGGAWSQSWSGRNGQSSVEGMPLSAMNAAMQAEMAAMGPEMQAGMAAMRVNLSGMSVHLEGLKSLHGPEDVQPQAEQPTRTVPAGTGSEVPLP
jgi:hypothetical protein